MPPTSDPCESDPARKPSANDVSDSLRRAIAAGELAPNQRLIELDLARELGTNRAVVRSALANLEQQRLLVREPNRGVRVRTYTADEAVEILEVRAALEGVVARRAATRIDETELRMLRAVADDMRACCERGDLLSYSAHNTRFHRAIAEIAEHQTASMLLAMLQSQAVRYQFRTVLEPGRIACSLAEHEAILGALEARDAQEAELAMRAHIDAVGRVVRSIGGNDTTTLVRSGV